MTRFSPLLPALALIAGLSAPALAQDAPTPAGAQALEGQLRAWLMSSTAGALPIPARPVEMTANGDHYDARVPLAQVVAVSPANAAYTASVKPLGGTRWQVDNPALPSDFTVTTMESVPDAADEKNPSPDGKHNETVTYHIKLGQHTGTGVVDTSHSTPTTSNSTLTAFDMEKTGGSSPSVTHFDSLTGQASVSPDGAQRLNILSDSTGQGYASKSALPDGSTLSITAQTVRFAGSLSSFDQAKAIMVLGQAAAAVKAASATPHEDGTPMSPADKARLRQLLVAANGLLSGGRLDESADNLKYDFSGHQGSVGKVDVAFNGDAPQDMLTASMVFTLDGLTVDELPPPLAAYVPTHFTIHPSISNISVKDLTKLGMDATAPAPAAGAVPGVKPKAAQELDVMALFKHGGINIGLDELALDLAGTQFTGTGKFNMTGPQTITGQAELKARGLEGLIEKAQNDPMLAQGVPVLIFLKGIAKTTGDQAVWQISVANQKVLVNGVDLSKMAGGLK